MGGEYNCLMENQAEATHRQTLQASAWLGAAAARPFPTRCCTAAAASRSPGPEGQRGPARPHCAPALLRSYPGVAASAAVHMQTRWAAVRSRGPRISAVSAWANVGSWGNSRAPRGVAFHLLPDFFSPLTLGFSSLKWARLKSGVRDLN